MEKQLKNRLNKLFKRVSPNKKEMEETKHEKTDSDKLFVTPQVTEKGDITTILFETGPRAFYSDTQERDIQNPDVLVLHKDAEDNYLMTWHGIERYTEPYSYDNGAITGEDDYYAFATRGMYLLNEQQAKTLLTSSGKEFQETLESIKAQENFKYKRLTEDASQQRSDFIEKDFNLAEKVRDKYFEGIKIQDQELRQKRTEQQKAEQTKKTNEETEKFLGMFSKFDPRGK